MKVTFEPPLDSDLFIRLLKVLAKLFPGISMEEIMPAVAMLPGARIQPEQMDADCVKEGIVVDRRLLDEAIMLIEQVVKDRYVSENLRVRALECQGELRRVRNAQERVLGA